jgi:hypothetical protein
MTAVALVAGRLPAAVVVEAWVDLSASQNSMGHHLPDCAPSQHDGKSDSPDVLLEMHFLEWLVPITDNHSPARDTTMMHVVVPTKRGHPGDVNHLDLNNFGRSCEKTVLWLRLPILSKIQ